jgi:hypothetical protein
MDAKCHPLKKKKRERVSNMLPKLLLLPVRQMLPLTVPSSVTLTLQFNGVVLWTQKKIQLVSDIAVVRERSVQMQRPTQGQGGSEPESVVPLAQSSATTSSLAQSRARVVPAGQRCHPAAVPSRPVDRTRQVACAAAPSAVFTVT